LVARKIAALTADLTDDQARWVDATVAGVLGTLPSGRLLTLVAARVVEADQTLADRKAEEAASARSVWMSRHDDHGNRTLVVRGEAAGVRRFHGAVNRVAHLLREHGDANQRAQSIDDLRADAVSLLANPLAALKLMIGTGEAACPDQVAQAIREAGPSKVRAPRPLSTSTWPPSHCRGEGSPGPRRSVRSPASSSSTCWDTTRSASAP
jgi:hypothetical protein